MKTKVCPASFANTLTRTELQLCHDGEPTAKVRKKFAKVEKIMIDLECELDELCTLALSKK